MESLQILRTRSLCPKLEPYTRCLRELPSEMVASVISNKISWGISNAVQKREQPLAKGFT